MSSEKIELVTKNRNPEFELKDVFLKVLCEGESNLYQYIHGNLIRYLYSNPNGEIEQLIFKSYRIKIKKIAHNNYFRQQLWNNLKCSSIKQSYVEQLKYNKEDLLEFFEKYNACINNEVLKVVDKKEKQNFDFNLNIRPRINSSSFVMENVAENPNMVTDFGNKLNFGFGIEMELILPFIKNKWSVFLEPTYQHFKGDASNNVSHINGGKQITTLDYQSIETPLGLRYAIFINNNSKLFVNAAVIMDLKLNSSFKFTRQDGSDLGNNYNTKLKTGNNFAIGLGYKFLDKYSIEARYQTPRELIESSPYFSSRYETTSLILGYTLF